jgi:hypothetical protein
MLGSSHDELLRVHAHRPLLAFLLAICNPSIVTIRTPWRPPVVDSQHNDVPEPSRLQMLQGILNGSRLTRRRWATELALNVVAAAGAGVMIWRTITLARQTLLVWACWTSIYPIVWLLLSPFAHVAQVFLAHLCLTYGGRHKEVLAEVANVAVSSLGKLTYVFGTCVLSSTSLGKPIHTRILRW